MKGLGSTPPGGTPNVGPPQASAIFDPRMQPENQKLAGSTTERLVASLAQALGQADVSAEEQKRMSEAQQQAAKAAMARRLVLDEADNGGWTEGTKVVV